MKSSISIRNLYLPVQPTVKATTDKVIYQEFLPATHLQSTIYCYWQLKTTQPLQESFKYSVVSDGCIDIFFELHQPELSTVMGFCKKYTQFPLDHSFHYIGIRFLPTMFPQLFGIPAFTLANQALDLKTVLPETAAFITQQFHSQKEIMNIIDQLNQYFIQKLADCSFDNDARLYEAIAIILKNYGVLNIEKDLNTGISPRQLRRLFKHYIGDSAKTFAQVVRFQNILRAKPSKQSLKQNKLFYQGYYDQAHFIKEFKNFYGVTPGVVYGR